jgi:hypothetical protein
MQSTNDKRTTYENGGPVDHFTKVPNELIDHLGLTPSEKLVLIKHCAEQFKTKTKPDSERRASKKLGVSRNTFSDTTGELVKLGLLEPHGNGGPRKQETYTVHLERLSSIPDPASGSNGVPVETNGSRQTGSNMSQASGSNGVPVLPKLAQIRATQKSRRITKTEDGSATLCQLLTSIGEETAKVDGIRVGQSAESAASPESAVPSGSEMNTQAKVIGNAELAPLPASNGRSTLLQSETSKPPRPPTKAEVNAAFIRPDGFSASDDFADLSDDLSNLILPMVVGEPLKESDLDKLVAKRGVTFCHFWAYWLPRKIAYEYEKGRPVPSPTGVYLSAVEQRWEVNPKWPEFDEQRHTVVAREQSVKRKLDRNLKSHHAKFTQAELSRLAEDVRKGQRQLDELPERIQPLVRDAIQSLQETEDEIDSLFGKNEKRANVSDEDLFEFGPSGNTALPSNDDELEDELEELPF